MVLAHLVAGFEAEIVKTRTMAAPPLRGAGRYPQTVAHASEALRRPRRGDLAAAWDNEHFTRPVRHALDL